MKVFEFKIQLIFFSVKFEHCHINVLTFIVSLINNPEVLDMLKCSKHDNFSLLKIKQLKDILKFYLFFFLLRVIFFYTYLYGITSSGTKARSLSAFVSGPAKL